MLGRVSDKCICSYCLTVVNLHEKQISEEDIMMSLPPSPQVSLLEAQCPCSSSDRHSASQAFLGPHTGCGLSRTENGEVATLHSRMIPFWEYHSPGASSGGGWMEGVRLLWCGLANRVLHWSPHLRSPTHPPCPLSSHTATHTRFLDPSLSDLPRVFPVPLSPLCIFRSSIR